MNNLAGAWIFYTTFPKLPFITPKFKNIAQFSPIIGFFIGLIQSLIYLILRNNSWSAYASVPICVASGYLITGGLHLDGLMDTFDGIFAGKNKCLKAMKDSQVGAFGVQSLFFITLMQIACLLKIQSQIISILPICLFWGRFSTLIFIDKFQYITLETKSIQHKKYWNGFKKESLVSLTFIFIFIFYFLFLDKSADFIIKQIFLLLIGFFISYAIPKFLGSKIGGFNGDACGASVVLVETTMLFINAVLL
ncbi:adenosylcobinamide-GDP ribazoletransferase [Prochlorococcus marinus]|uniref:adenosylcobinamide-GDP ribazoletransferase n=1 Tax=Prochlorococcus marinus TaxID=1219 RepID=UPI00059F7506